MLKILTALGNPVLNNELKKYEKYDVIGDDLQYQEAVFDKLIEDSADIIILSSLLQGQFEFLEFALEIKKKNISARIIIIADTISEEDKNILYSKGIFDIFLDDRVTLEEVIDAIDRDEPICKAHILSEIEADKYEVSQDVTPIITKQINITQKQEVIAISGTNGSGKSTIAVNIAKNLSKKTNSKILLIDLDTLNGNIDEILNINKVPTNVELLIDEDKKCGLNYVADLVSKNRFDTNVLEEITISAGKFDVITGNTSLHSCQNVLNEECYNKLLSCAKEKYDFIIIDTSSNIFLDSTKWALHNASKILFVTEDSRICIKKATQILNIFEHYWGVWNDKIKMLINKAKNNDLTGEMIEKILGIELIGTINQNNENVDAEYEKILRHINYIPKITIKERIGIAKNLLSSITKNNIGTIMPREEIKNAN